MCVLKIRGVFKAYLMSCFVQCLQPYCGNCLGNCSESVKQLSTYSCSEEEDDTGGLEFSCSKDEDGCEGLEFLQDKLWRKSLRRDMKQN